MLPPRSQTRAKLQRERGALECLRARLRFRENHGESLEARPLAGWERQAQHCNGRNFRGRRSRGCVAVPARHRAGALLDVACGAGQPALRLAGAGRDRWQSRRHRSVQRDAGRGSGGRRVRRGCTTAEWFCRWGPRASPFLWARSMAVQLRLCVDVLPGPRAGGHGDAARARTRGRVCRRGLRISWAWCPYLEDAPVFASVSQFFPPAPRPPPTPRHPEAFACRPLPVSSRRCCRRRELADVGVGTACCFELDVRSRLEEYSASDSGSKRQCLPVAGSPNTLIAEPARSPIGERVVREGNCCRSRRAVASASVFARVLSGYGGLGASLVARAAFSQDHPPRRALTRDYQPG
jgi:hypothetical protein